MTEDEQLDLANSVLNLENVATNETVSPLRDALECETNTNSADKFNEIYKYESSFFMK